MLKWCAFLIAHYLGWAVSSIIMIVVFNMMGETPLISPRWTYFPTMIITAWVWHRYVWKSKEKKEEE